MSACCSVSRAARLWYCFSWRWSSATFSLICAWSAFCLFSRFSVSDSTKFRWPIAYSRRKGKKDTGSKPTPQTNGISAETLSLACSMRFACASSTSTSTCTVPLKLSISTIIAVKYWGQGRRMLSVDFTSSKPSPS